MMRGPYNRGAVRLASMEAAREARAKRDLACMVFGSAVTFAMLALASWVL